MPCQEKALSMPQNLMGKLLGKIRNEAEKSFPDQSKSTLPSLTILHGCFTSGNF